MLPSPAYRVELIKEKNKHIYEVNINDASVRYPGVTGYLDVINKPALVPWAKGEALSSVSAALYKHSGQVISGQEWIDGIIKEAKVKPDQIRDDAADLGTRVHAFVDLIVKGQEPTETPAEIAGPVQAFRDWWKNAGIEVVAGDTKIASVLHGYGGSLDAVGKKDGKYILIDLKTSSGCYPEYALQVAAYAQALYETHGILCEKGMILRLGKKPPFEFEVKMLSDIGKSFAAFIFAKNLKDELDRKQYI